MRQMSGTTVLEQLRLVVLEHFKNSSTKLNKTNVWSNSSGTAVVVLEHFKNNSTKSKETSVWNSSSRTAVVVLEHLKTVLKVK